MKRAFDLMLLVLTAPLWLPLLGLTALALGLFQGRPVFFVQERIGRGGRPFRIFKFRTMTDRRGADGELLDDAERLTSVGRFVRKTSLDELPQLWNVLRGEMSLVGPRPLLPEYLPLYPAHHARRHEVRPGITGLAQISGRNLLGWDERLDLDVTYVERQSLALDLTILARTVAGVLTRRGVSSAEGPTMHRYRGPGS